MIQDRSLEVLDMLMAGVGLSHAEGDIERRIAAARQTGSDDAMRAILAQKDLLSFLRYGDLVEPASVAQAETRNDIGGREGTELPLFMELFCSGVTAAYRGEFASAASCFHAAEPVCSTHDVQADLAFMTAIADAHAETSSDALIASLRAGYERVTACSALDPIRIRGKTLLIEAEIARVRGDKLAALRLYDSAASAAEMAGLPHEQGLAHELAAGLSIAIGLTTGAQQHARQASDSYHRWGAYAKARMLDAQFLTSGAASAHGGSRSVRCEGQRFDPATIVRIAQALSEEILLDRVIDRLMESMLVQSGAQYGCLVLLHDGVPEVRAVARSAGPDILVELKTAAPSEEDLPLFVLDRVLTTGTALVAADMIGKPPFHLRDKKGYRPLRSLVCLPLVKHGTLMGLLTLEHAVLPDAFPEGKVAILEILMGQAAISLETARLYAAHMEGSAVRVHAEASLTRARASLARTSHLTVLGSLVASVAHEINQPLAVIANNAGAGLRWLRQSKPNVEEAMASLNDIRSDGLRAGGIVKTLRAMTQQPPVSLRRTCIDDIIRDVLDIMASEFDAKRVRVSRHLQAPLGEILGDPVQLQQLILNLVTNAVEAMHALPPSDKEVLVTSVQTDAAVIVQVRDKGPSLSREAVDQIFNPFYTTKEGGMGMGLAIARSIVEAHGGTLDVDGDTDEGTIFAFRLPLVKMK